MNKEENGRRSYQLRTVPITITRSLRKDVVLRTPNVSPGHCQQVAGMALIVLCCLVAVVAMFSINPPLGVGGLGLSFYYLDRLAHRK